MAPAPARQRVGTQGREMAVQMSEARLCGTELVGGMRCTWWDVMRTLRRGATNPRGQRYAPEPRVLPAHDEETADVESLESLAASNQSCSRAVRKRRLTNQQELSLIVDLRRFAPRHGRVARRSCLARRWWRHARNARLASGSRRVMETERHRHEALRTLGRKRRGRGLIDRGRRE